MYLLSFSLCNTEKAYDQSTHIPTHTEHIHTYTHIHTHTHTHTHTHDINWFLTFNCRINFVKHKFSNDDNVYFLHMYVFCTNTCFHTLCYVV